MFENKIKNPLVLERADPFCYLHTDGYYYFTGSVPGYKVIELRRAKNLNELKNAETVNIWHAHESGICSTLIWAPEIHFLNGKWYIYFAASGKSETMKEHHRMFVLECADENPLTGIWIEKGFVKTHQDSFSLDATIFQLQEKLYYVWAQKEPAIPGNSNLYIAQMENPWTLKTFPTLITIPTFDWEKHTYWVNEGPAVIVKNEKVIITYSASATDETYCMGMLVADTNSDLLDGWSWKKSPVPVFSSSEKNQQFGPGHNSFTTTPDGKEDILIYHARPEKNDFNNPLDNPNRHARGKYFTWGKDGLPVFGEAE